MQSICKCDCTIPNCGACTHKATASQAYTGSNQAHCTARLSAGLGNGQAHQAASTQRGPQSALSISFEPCVPYRVLVCSCLRNRSEKKSIGPNLRITFRFDYHQTRLVERFTNLQ